MLKIRLLSQEVVSKIAAGEVIERPAYAVKELIDNAIDAKADVIEIHIEESGLKRIHIIDNGEGMNKEDLELSFLPHTTSKLKNEDELIGIKTLGFRGEALASIAAISQMSIKSRTEDASSGTIIELRNNKAEHIGLIGMPKGTIVTVDNLFHLVPARKKFLKSLQTEFRHITEVIMRYALSYPNVHFILTHNKKTILDLPKKKEATERIKTLLGNSLSQQLVPFTFEDGYITLKGFLGKPQVASKQNQKQYLFVNNRHVTDKLISLAVKESFGTLLPASSTPVFIITVNIPHEMVDVNVHPRKEQVSFVNSKTLFDAVKIVVTQTLSEHNLTFNLAKFKTDTSAKIGETTTFAGELLKETVLPWNRTALIELKKNAPLLQIQQTYIATSTKNEMIFIDQHAAHERILYEQFVHAFETQKKKKEAYHLKKPLSLELSVAEQQIIEEHIEQFTKLGFGIEHFQGTSFVIRDVPIIFKGRNVQKLVLEILTDLADDLPKSIDAITQRMLAFLACRAAIMAGEPLTQKQMKDMLKQLEKTQHNTTCPHGRPTKITLPLSFLHRSFKRE